MCQCESVTAVMLCVSVQESHCSHVVCVSTWIQRLCCLRPRTSTAALSHKQSKQSNACTGNAVAMCMEAQELRGRGVCVSVRRDATENANKSRVTVQKGPEIRFCRTASRISMISHDDERASTTHKQFECFQIRYCNCISSVTSSQQTAVQHITKAMEIPSCTTEYLCNIYYLTSSFCRSYLHQTQEAACRHTRSNCALSHEIVCQADAAGMVRMRQ